MYVAPPLSFFFSRCFLVPGVVAEWWFNQKKAFTDLTYTLSLPRCAIVFKVYVYIYISITRLVQSTMALKKTLLTT
jgi:hypothetical protein